MSMESEQLKERAMQFADNVLALVDRFPPTAAGRVIAHQFAKSATSVASNDRATCIARSRAEFIAKLGTVVEEADESECWLELVRRRQMRPQTEVLPLRQEAAELRAIFGRSLGTARSNAKQRRKSVYIRVRDPINEQRTKVPNNQITR
jgi:four helix bundle protein